MCGFNIRGLKKSTVSYKVLSFSQWHRRSIANSTFSPNFLRLRSFDIFPRPYIFWGLKGTITFIVVPLGFDLLEGTMGLILKMCVCLSFYTCRRSLSIFVTIVRGRTETLMVRPFLFTIYMRIRSTVNILSKL